MTTNTTTLEAYGHRNGICKVAFSETGYEVVSDDRDIKIGYLHVTEESSESITDACRNQIIAYMFNHPDKMPGIGQTTMEKYFAGLTKADVEFIGNEGKKAFYT